MQIISICEKLAEQICFHILQHLIEMNELKNNTAFIIINEPISNNTAIILNPFHKNIGCCLPLDINAGLRILIAELCHQVQIQNIIKHYENTT